MNRTKRHLLSVILAMALLLLPTTVFAKELGMLTISGPGIKGEITLNNPDQLIKLEGSGFFDQASLMKQAPENLGQGYNISASLNLDGTMTPFVEMVYYPTEAGQPGYAHYTGRLNGETLKPVDQWARLSLSADNSFRALMTANKITLQSAIVAAPVAVAVVPQKQPEVQAESAPITAPAPVQVPYTAIALTAAVLVALGGALMLRRRAVSQRST
ncbi:MAG TPA: hypothetical protein VN653_08580 [Anaerolineales bacterium]|nr:hypothetical protein [Anaerolineales bacterium]